MNTAQNSERSEGVLDWIAFGLEHARILIIAGLVGFISSCAIAFLIAPVYTATARILPPQQPQGASQLANQLGILLGGAGAAAGIKNPTDLYVGLLRSRTVADLLVSRF